MDPASAAVAFVGFSASVVQLSAVTLNSCQTLHHFYKGYSNAPANVDRLAKLLKRLELVASRLHNLDTPCIEGSIQHNVDQFWEQHAREMKDDLEQFRNLVVKLEKKLKVKSHTPKQVFARLRVVFSDEETTKWEQVLSAHIATATSMLSVMTRYA